MTEVVMIIVLSVAIVCTVVGLIVLAKTIQGVEFLIKTILKDTNAIVTSNESYGKVIDKLLENTKRIREHEAVEHKEALRKLSAEITRLSRVAQKIN